jgi:hypothetical protein
MLVKSALGLVLLFAASACGGHSGALPYTVQFLNDTATAVSVVGCAHCGDGHLLPSGSSWRTSVGGGGTDVTFAHGGVTTGCTHFRNGALPTSSAPPSVIKVSAFSPCAT